MMIPLFSTMEFENAKPEQLLKLECKVCGRTFLKSKRYIKGQILNPNRHQSGDSCSHSCSSKLKSTSPPKEVECKQCSKIFTKRPDQIKKYPNHFCSHSCAATYNNAHKTTGNRRSKLEAWLEEQLTLLYPNLPILYNDKTAIASELDIYIPSLKLAFEINGIFHYEPIYGEDKMSQIQENDSNKFHLCYKHSISLCIIDVSKQLYFKPKTSQKYLDIIKGIIIKEL